MTIIGYDKPLYVLPCDHRDSFETKMFGWEGVRAKSFGFKVCWMRRAGVPLDILGVRPDLVVKNFNELMETLWNQ